MHLRLLGWSLRHRPWRHVLNIAVMAITVSVVMIFVSAVLELVRVNRVARDRDFERILVWTKVPTAGAGFPIAMAKQLEQIPGVKVVQSVRNFSGRHPSGATYYVAGEQDSGVDLSRDIFPVTQDVFDKWKGDRLGAIVTEATAQELDLKLGQHVEIPTAAGPMQVNVVGLSYGSTFAHRIVIHFDYAQELTNNRDTASTFRVITDPKDFASVAHEIDERTKNSPMPAQAVSDAQHMSSWVREVSFIPGLLGFLGAFLVLTTALTLANNTAISIRERQVETATLRVVGYRRGTILRMLLSTAVLVGFLGGVVAVGVTAIVFRSGIQLTPGTSRLLQAVTIDKWAIAIGLAVSVLIPMIGALPVAIRAARAPLVTALRENA